MHCGFYDVMSFSFVNVAKVGIVVVGCFAIVWLPFLLNGIDDVAILLRRIFPFYRGLFEVCLHFSSVCLLHCSDTHHLK